MQFVNTTGLPKSPTPAELPIFAPQKLGPSRLSARLRATVDASIALTVLIVASPVLLIAMLLVKLTSRGPILYSQTRLGRGAKPFSIFKLRSMRHESESMTGAVWCKPGDSRVTPIGRWLRKTHIDELPQLWNVLRGEMSLIGPRPERPEFVPQLELAIPHYRKRLEIRPGLTGLAQVQLPPDTDLNSVKRKLAYDLYYIRRGNPWLDMRIYFATVFHIAGLPFSFIRRAFRFPCCAKIERVYSEMNQVEGLHSLRCDIIKRSQSPGVPNAC